MTTAIASRHVRRHEAARSTISNTVDGVVFYDTNEVADAGFDWSSNASVVDSAGRYLAIYDVGQCDHASTRAVGTLLPRVNGSNVWDGYRASHRYLRNSGGTMGASIGRAFLNLADGDAVSVHVPGAIGNTDALGAFSTNSGFGGALQLIKFNDGNFTEVRRTVDSTEVGTSNINTIRPWLDSSGTWVKITYNSEVEDGAGLYPGTGGDITLKANKKYLIVWGASIYSAGNNRHAYVTRLNIGGDVVQSGSGYQRTTASQGPPHGGLYLHEVGGSDEVAFLEATQETEGGDAGVGTVDAAYMQILELPDGAEWIHADNGATDSLTASLAGTATWYDTPLSSTFRADGDSNLGLDVANNAIQNNAGEDLPLLAIGWHRWDRNAGTSGTRKIPWVAWENDGARLGYGIAGAFSRGQQGGDDTFQAHYTSAATITLADTKDLTLQVNDPANGVNSDMGIFASTSRHFLGVQVLNLNTLTAAPPVTSRRFFVIT